MVFEVMEGEEIIQRTLTEVAASYTSAEVTQDPSLLDYVDSDILYSNLTRDEIRRAAFKAEQILHVYNGPKEGIGARWEAAAAAVGISVKQLRKKAAHYFDRGLVGLVHQNRKVTGPTLEEFDERTISVVRQALAANVTASSSRPSTLRARVRADLLEADAPVPSHKKLQQLIDLLDAGHSALGTAKTRNTVSNRPKGSAFRRRSGFFADELEIDSWESDLLVWDAQGKERRAWVVVAVCTATKIGWVRVCPSHPTARDVGLLLHDIANPCPIEPQARPWLDVVCLPEKIAINAEPDLTTPDVGLGVVPGLIRLDHGTEGENLHVMSIAAQLGIDIEWARTMSPTDKAFIESRIADLAMFVELLPAHVGSSPEDRGTRASKGPRLKLWELQLLIDEWNHLSKYIPHRGLPDPTTPGKYWAPMQAFNMSITSGAPVRITPHVNLVYEFLPSFSAVASDDAVTFEGIDYTGPQLPMLTALSKGDSKRASRRLTFHYDPYDRTRIFWHAPGTMHWYVLRARSPENGEVVPPFSEILRQRLIDTPSRSRLSKTERDELKTLLIQYIRGFMKARGPGADYGLLISQLLAAVRDPLPVPTPFGLVSPVAEEVGSVWDDEGPGDDDDLEALIINDADWDEAPR